MNLWSIHTVKYQAATKINVVGLYILADMEGWPVYIVG